jgi:hypothetical protein
VKSYQETAFIDRKHFSQHGRIFYYHINQWMYDEPRQKSKTHHHHGEPFAAMATWLWQIGSPRPWELLWKGLSEGGAEGFNIFYCVAKKKNN